MKWSASLPFLRTSHEAHAFERGTMLASVTDKMQISFGAWGMNSRQPLENGLQK
jgi:hypothetical protein